MYRKNNSHYEGLDQSIPSRYNGSCKIKCFKKNTDTSIFLYVLSLLYIHVLLND